MQDSSRTRVRQIGSSLGIIIPNAVVRAYGLRRGDVVGIDILEAQHFKIYKVTDDNP